MPMAVQLVDSHITQSADVCGGRACVDNTRIRVLDIAVLDRAGRTPAEIRMAYPSLSLAQIHAALSYADEHEAEITGQLDEDRRTAERIEQARAQLLSKSKGAGSLRRPTPSKS
jgi:uncharacterized protein (DUF433 family)